MPGGIRLFLAYAFLILAGIGLSLRFVIDQAISAPVSLPGVVVMVLLAYTIFTTTLVIQRKQAAREPRAGAGQPDGAADPAAAPERAGPADASSSRRSRSCSSAACCGRRSRRT